MALSRSDSNNKKTCWVCYATEDDDLVAQWLQPCRCRGTSRWVHVRCLQRWIDEKQKGNTFRSVRCPQCNSEYMIIYPKLGKFMFLLSKIDNSVVRFSPVICAGVVLGSLYWSSLTYGFITVLQVVGYNDGLALLERADFRVLFFGLPSIPVALIFSKLINWDDYVFRFLNRYVFRRIDRLGIPGVMWNGVYNASTALSPVSSGSNQQLHQQQPQPYEPTGTDEGQQTCERFVRDEDDAVAVQSHSLVQNSQTLGNEPHEIVEGNGDDDDDDDENDNEQAGGDVGLAQQQQNLFALHQPLSAVRVFSGALTLPTISSLMGRVFFPFIKEQWRRTLLGGVFYVGVKGVVKMYYRRQQMIRIAYRRVKDIPDDVEVAVQTDASFLTQESALALTPEAESVVPLPENEAGVSLRDYDLVANSQPVSKDVFKDGLQGDSLFGKSAQ